MKSTSIYVLIILSISAYICAEVGLFSFKIVALAFFAPIYLGLIINMVVRRKLEAKQYFLSPWNFLTHKKEFEIQSDIEINTLFEKVAELLAGDPRFTLRKKNKKEGLILATGSLSVFSWGENYYFTVTNEANSTAIKIEMATIFGLDLSGRMTDHFKQFSKSFEQSLIV